MLAKTSDGTRPEEGPPASDESDAPRGSRKQARSRDEDRRGKWRDVPGEQPLDRWLTRNWRPMVMLGLLVTLVLVGAVLPLVEALAGQRLAVEPRWNLLPPEFWDFLIFTMSGYIGGRSLEKIAAQLSR